MSWMPTRAPVAHHLEACLQQQLLGEGVADLHRRPPLLGPLVEGLGGHDRAVDPVLPVLEPT